MRATFLVLFIILFGALVISMAIDYEHSNSWCVSGKLQGPCDKWPMKDIPESLKYHVK